jgi:hypothetical protein
MRCAVLRRQCESGSPSFEVTCFCASSYAGYHEELVAVKDRWSAGFAGGHAYPNASESPALGEDTETGGGVVRRWTAPLRASAALVIGRGRESCFLCPMAPAGRRYQSKPASRLIPRIVCQKRRLVDEATLEALCNWARAYRWLVVTDIP